jgi:hypothetical protein
LSKLDFFINLNDHGVMSLWCVHYLGSYCSLRPPLLFIVETGYWGPGDMYSGTSTFGDTYAFRHLSGAYRVCHSEQELSTPARGAAWAKAPPPSNTPNQNHPQHSTQCACAHHTTLHHTPLQQDCCCYAYWWWNS